MLYRHRHRRQAADTGAGKAEGGTVHQGDRALLAYDEAGHPHHGRADVHHRHRPHHRRVGLAADDGRQLRTPVCVPVRAGIRRYRIYRRLSEGEAPPEHRPDRAAEVYFAAGGGGGVPVPDAVRGDAEPQPVYSLLEHPHRAAVDRVSGVRGLCDRGHRQRREYHGRSGWTEQQCDRAGGSVLPGDGGDLARLRAAGAVLRRTGGRSAGVPAVQPLSGQGVHGRYGVAVSGRRRGGAGLRL